MTPALPPSYPPCNTPSACSPGSKTRYCTEKRRPQSGSHSILFHVRAKLFYLLLDSPFVEVVKFSPFPDTLKLFGTGFNEALDQFLFTNILALFLERIQIKVPDQAMRRTDPPAKSRPCPVSYFFILSLYGFHQLFVRLASAFDVFKKFFKCGVCLSPIFV